MSAFKSSREYLKALAGVSSASPLAASFGSSLAQREYEKSIAQITSIEKQTKSLGLAAQLQGSASEMAGLTSSKILQGAFAGLTLERECAAVTAAQGTTRMLENASGSGAALREYAKAMDLTSQVKKLALGFDVKAVSNEYLRVVEAASATIQLAKTFGGTSAHLDYLKGPASASWIQQLSKSMVEDDLYRRFLGTFEARQSISSEIWSSAAAEIAKHRYDKLFSVSDVWAKQIELLKRPEYLDTLLATIERDVSGHRSHAEDFAGNDVEDQDGEMLFGQLGQVDSPERFREVLSRCSPGIKWVLLNILLYVMLPAMIGISVNLVTPHLEDYLHRNQAVTQREQIKDIKKLSMGELGLALRDYRFVTAPTLVLRANANSRSAQVGKLQFGQVVAVVSSQRDWTKVAYEYGGGQVVTGWVFTRYTEKFRR
ncbi:SH3 domain-containing protein [Nitrosospira sp. Nsp2]|uniref:SH3 domain-containing protein n=1 Tax=Nitrosospira sp. Nsp2 TaxID=136548 RepID=UPI000D2FEE98|nr:SH3 domain-containing protein [Nitrosospira sp. Nsp2]PTR16943.1 SH3 domain-containing protein [Nitrosospira sp. Nsp2]